MNMSAMLDIECVLLRLSCHVLVKLSLIKYPNKQIRPGNVVFIILCAPSISFTSEKKKIPSAIIQTDKYSDNLYCLLNKTLPVNITKTLLDDLANN